AKFVPPRTRSRVLFGSRLLILPDRRSFPTRRSSDLTLGRTTGGVALHDEKLAFLGVGRLTVSQLAGQTTTAEQSFAAAREITRLDRKSTRLNSSHVKISYAVFCLKKKKSGMDFATKA